MHVELFFPFDISDSGPAPNVEVVFSLPELEMVCNFYADVGPSE